MITDRHGNHVDEATALHRIVAALDLRFPDHNALGDRLGRLLEEIGELAEVILAIESERRFSPSAKELQDVLRSAGGIAHHYQLPVRLPDTSIYRRDANPYVLLTQLTQAAGALAQVVHHTVGMGMKFDKHGPPDTARLAGAVDVVIIRTLILTDHYQQRDALRASIETYYRNYQRDGFLPDEP